jgi:hypothetical protein
VGITQERYMQSAAQARALAKGIPHVASAYHNGGRGPANGHGGTGAPEARTEVHKEAVVSHWLEYGDLSPVARRTNAPIRYRNNRRARPDKGSPWVVTMALSKMEMPGGKMLGKAVGQLGAESTAQRSVTADAGVHEESDLPVALP